MEKLPLETQTLISELMESLMALEAHRSVGHISGCFTTKTVKGECYWYFQYSEPGGLTKQIYLGKKSPIFDKVVDEYTTEHKAYEADLARIQRLCAQIRAGGAMATDAATARVLKAFSDSGVFALKGVLVGTHAFAVLGNMLGVVWKGAALKTQDIDIAGELAVGIALPDLAPDIPRILENLQMGFIPIPPLNPKAPSTSFRIRGKELRVDILTPAARPTITGPVYISRFNAAAQPLRFLDYLIENPERGVAINGGGVLVNVPAPARFAFHKLMISQERPATMHGKVEKDLMQAEQLFELLVEERPGDILLAWDDAVKRGKGWVKRITQGIVKLEKRNMDAGERLMKLIGL